MTPKEASKEKNKGKVYFNTYGDLSQSVTKQTSNPKYQIEDQVRISKLKGHFEKGFTPNWTEEIFVIHEIPKTNPVTYKVKDLNNEVIEGSFYEQELSPTTQDIFRIEKIIRRDYKNKQALVKWKGYSDKFNSWIKFKDLKNIK